MLAEGRVIPLNPVLSADRLAAVPGGANPAPTLTCPALDVTVDPSIYASIVSATLVTETDAPMATLLEPAKPPEMATIVVESPALMAMLPDAASVAPSWTLRLDGVS